jgi:hypothetical protein
MNRVSVHLADRPPTLVPCRIADGWAAFEAAAFGALGLDARTQQLAELWLCTREGVAEALLPHHLLRNALRDMDHVLLRLAAREASPKAAPPPAEASARAAPRETAAAPPATPASGADMPPPPPAARAAPQRDDMSRHVTVFISVSGSDLFWRRAPPRRAKGRAHFPRSRLPASPSARRSTLLEDVAADLAHRES